MFPLKLSRASVPHLKPQSRILRKIERSLSQALPEEERCVPPFESILVANRGEIACRVINTAKRMGMRTISVYSEIDLNAKHVKMADEAVCIGPTKASESYLKVDAILDAIKATNARSVHPGYGFLSENSEFAKAVEALGVAFVGPPSSAIESMGDKLMSKQIAIEAGINTIPGFQGIIRDEEHAKQVANEIGYPVMIKASAGGGGKGMRIAWNDAETEEGFRLSRDEAVSSFGDDRLLIEKFIEEPHHIEIQLIADQMGKVVCFPERECSVQRRNQKVLEESPSALLSPGTRKAMCAQAAQLATAVGYHSAGTVEFLADKYQNFYFLEMNTRLQVEHPVTEFVSGEDLVSHMLTVAAGDPLPAHLTTDSVTESIKGWSMEARVYAEDPLRNFMPSTGTLVKYCEPPGATSFDLRGAVRVDSGVEEGANIGTAYDPMICKLISHGQDRAECIRMLSEALQRYVIHSPTLRHNIPFLCDVLRAPRFMDGHTPTSYIDEEYPQGFKGVALTSQEVLHTIAVAALIRTARSSAMSSSSCDEKEWYVQIDNSEDDDGAWYHAAVVQRRDGETNAERTAVEVTSTMTMPSEEEGEACGLEPVVRTRRTTRVVEVNDWSWPLEETMVEAELDGAPLMFQYHGDWGSKASTSFCGLDLGYQGMVMGVKVRSPREHELYAHMLPPAVVDVEDIVLSPMPGLLVSIAVEEGQDVQAGQEVAVVEAMKMQNVLRSPRTGRVEKVHASQGASLNVDQIIVSLEAKEETSE